MLKGDPEDNALTERIIGCAIEVHRVLGPGLAEASYEAALALELAYRGLPFARQLGFPVFYKGHLIGEHRPDLLVAERIVVEVKAIERIAPLHQAQVDTYVRVARLASGLLLNFNSAVMKDGVRRIFVDYDQR